MSFFEKRQFLAISVWNGQNWAFWKSEILIENLSALRSYLHLTNKNNEIKKYNCCFLKIAFLTAPRYHVNSRRNFNPFFNLKCAQKEFQNNYEIKLARRWLDSSLIRKFKYRQNKPIFLKISLRRFSCAVYFSNSQNNSDAANLLQRASSNLRSHNFKLR